jgi:signal transduction histidine kinase
MVSTGSAVICGDSACEECTGDMRRMLPHGQYVKLQVSDTGHGIAEDVQSRMFDPYYSTKSIGRGLGLAAVHGIVRSHGGAILTKSSPGDGALFEVLLPAARMMEGSA